MSTAPKRCLYEVLGLQQTCAPDEIRSAYKKLALQRHPDKLVKSGLSSADATAAFQELVHAYEVLSDPKERQWYDSHRSQILFADLSGSDASSPAGIPNLFSYFSPSCYTDYSDPRRGFYKVYSEVFDKIFANEVNYAKRLGLGVGTVKEAPLMGDLKSPYAQVNAFYGYWLGFVTVMDFGWLVKWDASAGENRRVRRLMEEENKKLRKKAKREFNETVRGLAQFVKKRDKRVIDMLVQKEKEKEKKREEELAKKKKMEREKLEKARMFEEPEWARVEEEVQDIDEEEDEGEEEKKEWYCMACGKKFKSDKQWKNHEQSKKHKDKVAELKASFADEDDEENFEEPEINEEDEENFEEPEINEEDDENFEDIENNEVDGVEDVHHSDESEAEVGDHVSFQFAEDATKGLDKELEEGLSIQEENGSELPLVVEDDNVQEPSKGEKTVESDDEISVLESMVSVRNRRRRRAAKNQPKASATREVRVVSEDEEEILEYNNRKKGSRKNRRAKGGKAKFVEEDSTNGHTDANVPNEENGTLNKVEEPDDVNENEAKRDDLSHTESLGSKADTVRKAKNSTKAAKQKGKSKESKQSANLCEKCGEEFESRNKLHKHLSDTGHAKLKAR